MRNHIEIENIYKNSINKLFRYVMYKLSNKEYAEDVVSETFLKVLEYRDLKTIRNKNAWIFKIARNIIYDKYKQEQKTESIDNVTLEKPDMDTDNNLEQKLINEDLTYLIKNALKKLDEKTEEVIILKIWENMKFIEIGRIINENEGTVKMRYYRGINKLKKYLEESNKQKMFGFGLPALILGITQLGKSREFIIDPKFARALLDQIRENNLFFTQKVMNSQKVNILKNILKKFLKKKKYLMIPLGLIVIMALIIVCLKVLKWKEEGSPEANNPVEVTVTPTPTVKPTVTETQTPIVNMQQCEAKMLENDDVEVIFTYDPREWTCTHAFGLGEPGSGRLYFTSLKGTTGVSISVGWTMAWTGFTSVCDDYDNPENPDPEICKGELLLSSDNVKIYKVFEKNYDSTSNPHYGDYGYIGNIGNFNGGKTPEKWKDLYGGFGVTITEPDFYLPGTHLSQAQYDQLKKLLDQVTIVK